MQAKIKKPEFHLLRTSMLRDQDQLYNLFVLGVGSDLDIYYEIDPSIPELEAKIVVAATEFINSAETRYNLRGYTDPIKHSFLPMADIKPRKAQLKEASDQGGATLDLWSFNLTSNKDEPRLLQPEFLTGLDLLGDFIDGFYHYLEGGTTASQKQIIRGLRALLELPFLAIKDVAVIEQQLAKLDLKNLDMAARQQLEKLIRNAYTSAANTRAHREVGGILSLLAKHNLVPWFANRSPINYQRQVTGKFGDIISKNLINVDTFLTEHCHHSGDEYELFHGTNSQAMLNILRGGFITSNNTIGQGTSLYGSGLYSSQDKDLAATYAASNRGHVFVLKVLRNPAMRILNLDDLNDKRIKLLTDEAKDKGYTDLNDLLYHEYNIDIVLRTHTIIQNVNVFRKPDLNDILDAMSDEIWSGLASKEVSNIQNAIELWPNMQNLYRLLSGTDNSKLLLLEQRYKNAILMLTEDPLDRFLIDGKIFTTNELEKADNLINSLTQRGIIHFRQTADFKSEARQAALNYLKGSDIPEDKYIEWFTKYCFKKPSDLEMMQAIAANPPRTISESGIEQLTVYLQQHIIDFNLLTINSISSELKKAITNFISQKVDVLQYPDLNQILNAASDEALTAIQMTITVPNIKQRYDNLEKSLKFMSLYKRLSWQSNEQLLAFTKRFDNVVMELVAAYIDGKIHKDSPLRLTEGYELIDILRLKECISEVQYIAYKQAIEKSAVEYLSTKFIDEETFINWAYHNDYIDDYITQILVDHHPSISSLNAFIGLWQKINDRSNDFYIPDEIKTKLLHATRDKILLFIEKNHMDIEDAAQWFAYTTELHEEYNTGAKKEIILDVSAAIMAKIIDNPPQNITLEQCKNLLMWLCYSWQNNSLRLENSAQFIRAVCSSFMKPGEGLQDFLKTLPSMTETFVDSMAVLSHRYAISDAMKDVNKLKDVLQGVDFSPSDRDFLIKEALVQGIVNGCNPECFKLLLNKGDYVNARVKYESWPKEQSILMIAVQYGRLELVKILLDANVRVSLKDRSTVTILDLVAKNYERHISNHNKKMLSMLVRHIALQTYATSNKNVLIRAVINDDSSAFNECLSKEGISREELQQAKKALAFMKKYLPMDNISETALLKYEKDHLPPKDPLHKKILSMFRHFNREAQSTESSSQYNLVLNALERMSTENMVSSELQAALINIAPAKDDKEAVFRFIALCVLDFEGGVYKKTVIRASSVPFSTEVYKYVKEFKDSLEKLPPDDPLKERFLVKATDGTEIKGFFASLDLQLSIAGSPLTDAQVNELDATDFTIPKKSINWETFTAVPERMAIISRFLDAEIQMRAATERHMSHKGNV